VRGDSELLVQSHLIPWWSFRAHLLRLSYMEPWKQGWPCLLLLFVAFCFPILRSFHFAPVLG
jgi:hypothetical protein